MTIQLEHLTLVGLMLVGACDIGNKDIGNDESAEDSTETTQGESETTQGETQDETGGADTGLTIEEFLTQCPMQLDRASCEAFPDIPFDDQTGTGALCSWVVAVPTTLDGDTCVYGEPVGSCQAEVLGEEGCYSNLGCSLDIGWSRMEGDELILVRTEGCEPHGLDAQWCGLEDGEVVSGVPECACLCDPNFPE